MHDDDMVPNVRTGEKKRRKGGRAKNLLEAEVGEVVVIAVRLCRHTAGPGGRKEDISDVFVNGYDRKNDKEIHHLFTVPRAALIPVEDTDMLDALLAVKHLLPDPDDLIDDGDIEKLKHVRRLIGG